MLLINNSYSSFLTNITFKKDVLSDFKSRAEQCFTWSWLFLFEFLPKGEFFFSRRDDSAIFLTFSQNFTPPYKSINKH